MSFQWLAPIKTMQGNANLPITFNLYLIGLANKRYNASDTKYDSYVYPINNATVHFMWGENWTSGSNNLGIEMFFVGI